MEITYESILNKPMLLEVYNYSKQDEFLDRVQMMGSVIFAQENGMAFKIDESGRVLTLSGDLSYIEAADPNGYELDATGETVHPELITAYKVYVE